MEILSEHLCQGWLEGYLLTGPARILQLLRGLHPHRRFDVQPAREVAEDLQSHPWRRPIARSTTCFHPRLAPGSQRLHHQDPGFIDHVVNKKAEIIRVYLPPDANCLLSVTDHCLRSRNYVNVIVAGKQPAAVAVDGGCDHALHAGIGIWEWASNDAGPSPTSSWPAAATSDARDAGRRGFSGARARLKIRVVNVVDLMTLQPRAITRSGLNDYDFDVLFTMDGPWCSRSTAIRG